MTTPAASGAKAKNHTVETVRGAIANMNPGLDQDMFVKLLAIIDEQTRALADMREALEQIKRQPVLTRVVTDSVMRKTDHEVLSAYHVLHIVDEALSRSPGL